MERLASGPGAANRDDPTGDRHTQEALREGGLAADA